MARSLPLRFEPGLGFPHPVISFTYLPRRSGADSPLNPGHLPSVHVFFHACCKPVAGDEERRTILRAQELAFRERGRHADLPLCFRVIRAMVEGCKAPGLREEWHPSNPASGKEGTGKAWRERKRLDCVLKVTVSLSASAWGLLPCGGNRTRQVGEQENVDCLGNQVHSSRA